MKTSEKLSITLATVLLASAAFMSSCQKKTTTTPDSDTSAAADNNTAEWAANDAVTMAGQASESGSVSYKMGNDNSVLSSCATVTVNTTSKIITVTFSGGACNDGHVRSGTLTFDYSQSTGGAVYYRNPGYKCIVTSTNYVVDLNHVAITHTVTNTTPAGFNPATTNMTWSVGGAVTIVKAGNGGTITWNCNRTHTLLNTAALTYAGTAYPASYVDQNTVIDWAHAIVSVGGTASGTTAKGESYTFNTTSPLIVNMNCAPDPNKPGRHPIVQGAFDFKPGNKGNRHVDFGSGTCDMICQVTITGTDGNTYGPYTITLP
ncbi:MAG TPA: hypothetical protein VNZ49_01100 [Bacteroidia bacterium]|jgi:hypothetical protein|nr:hypothetical protein [Bacteroidia bacterium]